MKKTVYSLFLIVMMAWSCTRKALPVITERKTEPPVPVNKLINLQPDMALGKTLFVNRCNRCHDLPKPDQYTAPRWEGILSYMIPKARLTAEQGFHVTAYLKSNAAK